MRDSRDGDYRILQAVTQNPQSGIELGQTLVGPLSNLAHARVGIC